MKKPYNIKISNVNVDFHDDTLPIREYEQFYQAILHDADTLVSDILRDNMAIMDAKFDFSSPEDTELPTSALKKSKVQAHFPITVAVCMGSTKVLQLLIEYGANLMVLEHNECNIIHMLLKTAWSETVKEEKLIKVYKILMYTAEIEALLRQENIFNLRPLELAAGVGLLTFVRLILNTPGVYLTNQVTKGRVTYKWYDITEYESYKCGNRSNRSPILLINNLDLSDLEKPQNNDFFKWSVIKQWIDNKYMCNIPLVFLWLVIRMSYIFLCFIDDIYEVDNSKVGNFNSISTNSSKCMSVYNTLSLPLGKKYMLTLFIAITSFLFISFDVFDFIAIAFLRGKANKGLKAMKMLKCAVVSNEIFRSLHFSFCLNMAIFSLSKIISRDIDSPTKPQKLVLLLTASWSLLYFVQLLKNVGYIVVIFERLIILTGSLIVILIIVFLPFVHVFVKSYTELSYCDGIRTDSPSTAFYDVFSIYLNTVTFQNDAAVYVYHFLYILLISTILMNLLIALYSEIVTKLSPHHSIIMQLQRLFIMLTLERRFGNLLCFYYTAVQPLYFTVKDKRVYILETDQEPINND